MARDPHNDYYTAISWTSDRKYKSDSATFIFTLTNPHMTYSSTKFLYESLQK